MISRLQRNIEIQRAVARVKTYVANGGWLGTSWPTYGELAIPEDLVPLVEEALPPEVWWLSQENFEYEDEKAWLERERQNQEQ